MVRELFLIWDGLGVVGDGGGQLPKKLLHKEKVPKNIMQSDSRKRNREQINGKIVYLRKKLPNPRSK